MKTIDFAIDQITKPVFKKFGIVNQKIISSWPLIVGDNIAKFSNPVKVSFPKKNSNNGTLYIESYNSAIATELSYMQEVIIEKISIFFGYKAIEKIKIMHKPKRLPEEETTNLPERALSAEENKQLSLMLDGIDDEDLRASLESLGKSVIGSSKS